MSTRKENPILGIQQWIEQEVIERGTCPPMVKLAQAARGEDKKIDWGKLSKDVVLVDLTNLDPNSEEPFNRVASEHYDFIAKSAEGTAPVALNFILPDFASNQDFDKFLQKLMGVTFIKLCNTPEGVDLAKRAFAAIARAHNAPEEDIAIALKSGDADTKFPKWVLYTHFKPLNFYGQRISDQAGIPHSELPRDSLKVMFRAPYYLLQFVNPIKSPAIVGNLNSIALRKRNAELASSIDLDDYEEVMQSFRVPRA